MNRREFFARMNPFRAVQEGGASPAAEAAASQNALFLLAMERGIDPATVDPERLPELLGLKAGNPSHTGK